MTSKAAEDQYNKSMIIVIFISGAGFFLVWVSLRRRVVILLWGLDCSFWLVCFIFGGSGWRVYFWLIFFFLVLLLFFLLLITDWVVSILLLYFFCGVTFLCRVICIRLYWSCSFGIRRLVIFCKDCRVLFRLKCFFLFDIMVFRLIFSNIWLVVNLFCRFILVFLEVWMFEFGWTFLVTTYRLQSWWFYFFICWFIGSGQLTTLASS